MVETLYRLEGPDGYGPYCYEPRADPSEGLDLIDSADASHPNPGGDGIDVVGAGWDAWGHRHGFRSVDAMLAWFHSTSLEALIYGGYSVKEYTIPAEDVLHGDHQSVFRPERAESVTWISREDLS